MKKQILLFTLLFIFSYSFSQKATETTEISVLTCSAGPELYTAFGHSAFRVKDTVRNFDFVYNYGSFNFNIPNFYLKFIRGNLYYMCAVEQYSSFESSYAKDNRDVYEQTLNLTFAEKDKLFKYLQWRSRPENREYLYDFFFDNCATRIRDDLENQFGDSLAYPQKEYSVTLRQMINPYLADRPWLHLGINMLLGLPSDIKADIHYAQFLPDYMDTIFTSTVIITENNKKELIKSREHIVKRLDKHEEKSFLQKYFVPVYVLWAIFGLILLFTIWEFIKKRKNYIIDFILLFLFGISGLLILFMWFGTHHNAVANNLNFLWALPTHLILSFFLFKKQKSNFVKKYYLIAGIYNLLFLIAWFFLPQEFDIALIPLILSLTVRFFGGYLYEK